MNLKGLRLPIIVIIFLVSLSLLLGGQWIYQKKHVQGNLIEQLNNIDGVYSSIIDKSNKHTQIKIHLGEVNDLRHVYMQVTSVAAAHLKSEEFTLEIVDQPNQQLKSLWEVSHLSIYQSLAQAQFDEIDRKISIEAKKHDNIKYKVQMDWDNIYVQLHAEGDYLYRIIPRLPTNQPDIYLAQRGEKK
ncbi:MAG: hypothetical protein ACOY9Y_03585 [Bacillota bacterium]